MRKQVFGRQLSRDANERKALFKGLINSLVILESIQTTEAKAKSIKGQVEKLITKAKLSKAKSASGGKTPQAVKSLLQPWLQKEALEKVMNDLAVRFANRPGGYTRIIKLGERFGDNATMVVIEFVEKSSVVRDMGNKKTKENKKETVETTLKTDKEQPKPAKKTQQPKESKKTSQRPPSKATMEGRKSTKGSPAKEASK